jgi:chaperonin GroES
MIGSTEPPLAVAPHMVYYMGGSHSHNTSAKDEKTSHNSSTYHISKLGRNGMSTVSLKIQPLGDRVVVKALARDTVTKSGIVLPDTAKEKPQEGEVLAVGPGKVLDNGKRTSPEVKVGERVLFARYAGTEIKIDGEEYLILRESDVMGIVE